MFYTKEIDTTKERNSEEWCGLTRKKRNIYIYIYNFCFKSLVANLHKARCCFCVSSFSLFLSTMTSSHPVINPES